MMLQTICIRDQKPFYNIRCDHINISKITHLYDIKVIKISDKSNNFTSKPKKTVHSLQ